MLEFECMCRDPKTQEVFEAIPLFVTVERTQFASTKENQEVLLQKARQQTYLKMKVATINDTQNDLKNNDYLDALKSNIDALISELSQFSKFIESREIYKNVELNKADLPVPMPSPSNSK